MSELNHYERLGVTENSSFEEIQDAKKRLVEACAGDRQAVEAIEASYDAILMDRLRQRQEGKIKVPDRIRFPEKLAEPPQEPPSTVAPKGPDWVQRMIDTPSRDDILWPAGLFLAASLLSLTAPPVALAFGVGFSLYFLNRKERKFGRALLLTLAGLILGVLLGLQLGTWLLPQLTAVQVSQETFAALVTFIVLWLISSFLR